MDSSHSTRTRIIIKNRYTISNTDPHTNIREVGDNSIHILKRRRHNAILQFVYYMRGNNTAHGTMNLVWDNQLRIRNLKFPYQYLSAGQNMIINVACVRCNIEPRIGKLWVRGIAFCGESNDSRG